MATGAGTGTAVSTSGTTLEDIKTICNYHGWHDNTTSGDGALTRFINRTLQLLSMLAPWPEYHKRDGTITLATDDEDYALDETNIARVGNITRTDRSAPLEVISIDDWLIKTKTFAMGGTPTMVAFRKYVSTGDIKMEALVYPKPTSSQNGDILYYPYWLYPSELSADSDVTDWPDYRMWLLDEALDIRISTGNRDSGGASLQTPEFYALVQKAMGDSRVSYIPLPASKPVDYRNARINEIPMQVTS